jgi:BlaI family transcriptional regulator, penicillinase repressor
MVAVRLNAVKGVRAPAPVRSVSLTYDNNRSNLRRMTSRAPAPEPPAPTEAELDVLRVLWERGPSTVREVFEAIARDKAVVYTTVLKQMQVMQQKGLLTRSERFRSHVYEPAQERAATQTRLASSMLHRVFGGSARSLLQSALAGRKVKASELDEIRRLLDDYQRRPK